MGQEMGGGCTETGRAEGALGDGEGVKKRKAAPGEGSGPEENASEGNRPTVPDAQRTLTRNAGSAIWFYQGTRRGEAVSLAA